ncbi:MAG: O-antigen ligase family protein [Patescibacteria group bacterium]
MTFEKLHKKIFYLIILFLPVNMGYHFSSINSYVEGYLVDYLIPTLFLLDLLILLLIFTWMLSIRFKVKSLGNIFLVKEPLIYFFVAALLSTLLSIRFSVSYHYFLRLCLYLLFFVYTQFNFNQKKDFPVLMRILSLSLMLLTFLGFLQWVNQSSLFNNYLFFGEQPYNANTKGVVTDNIFGRVKIPPYGLFRHPNVFGGFLSVIIVWLIYYWYKVPKLMFLFIASIFVLVLTLSQMAWISFIVGLLLLILFTTRFKYMNSFYKILVFLILVAGLLVPLVSQNKLVSSYSSLYRRVDLARGSLEIVKQYPLFGSGLNTNTTLIEKYIYKVESVRFPQPVHNVFLLLISEAGVIALVSFLFMFVRTLHHLLNRKDNFAKLMLVSLAQFIILGSFDHYIFTILQTQVLFWLTLGMSLAYNDVDET